VAWTYDPTNLDTSTASGRLNSVRLLIGDTDILEQILQDEEIVFSLSQTSDNVYYAGSWACHMIASKYSRLVDTRLEGAGETNYSDLAKQYLTMSEHLLDLGKRTNGRSLGAFAGGISNSTMSTVESDTDRPSSSFKVNQFDNQRSGISTPDYYYGV